MVFDIPKSLAIGSIQSNFVIGKKHNQPFYGNNVEDSFQYTSLSKYTNENAIRKMISANPKIISILKNNEIRLNMTELNTLLSGHAQDTQNIAKGIIENLPFSLKGRVNEKAVSDASYLHDIGKVLIPVDILNKKGKLTAEESEIMHKHSELGYEILKNTGIDPKTLNLVKYHHQNASHTGYPKVPSDFFADINLQILSAADKYSALLEPRVYKAPMDKNQALALIYRDVAKGNLHPFVFKALKDYAEKSTTTLCV